ncbi:alpha/beta hydrolase [Oscillospiraceae bacterium 50-60]
MELQRFEIETIPCVLWGAESDRVIVGIHGAQSHKEDTPFRLLAETAAGCQVLCFDLPDHGDRQGELCKPPSCVRDLTAVLDYAEARWKHIGLFAVSMGAYFGLLACWDRRIEGAWFLSPVVDMGALINNMMTWFDVSPERLKQEQAVPTPMGQTLYWDYYCYVWEHPIRRWPIPTEILTGGRDTLCDPAVTASFADRFSCRLRTEETAEHWFHTESDLSALERWLRETGGDFIR